MPTRAVGCLLLLCAATAVSALCDVPVNPYREAYKKQKFSFNQPDVNPFTLAYKKNKWTSGANSYTGLYSTKKWSPGMQPPPPPTPPSSSGGRGDRPEGPGENYGLLLAGVLVGAGFALRESELVAVLTSLKLKFNVAEVELGDAKAAA
jgi:hypothetical protein